MLCRGSGSAGVQHNCLVTEHPEGWKKVEMVIVSSILRNVVIIYNNICKLGRLQEAILKKGQSVRGTLSKGRTRNERNFTNKRTKNEKNNFQ